MIIYKITNKINGESYIGQTVKSLDVRFGQHCTKNSRCTRIGRAIQKYGKDNFEIKVLVKCSTIDEMNTRESFCIRIFNTISPNGYNLTSGGDRPKFYNERKPISEENRKARSLRSSGKNNPNYGKPKSIKWYEKQKLRIGKPVVWKSGKPSRLGIKLTDETRNKISEACKGKSPWNKGIEMSLEQKLKLSQISVLKRKLINTITGETINSIKELAVKLNMNYCTLKGWMGPFKQRNKTPWQYEKKED